MDAMMEDGRLERGIFVTFEGGEGSGKSTQIRRLADYLAQDGLSVTVTREPGGTAAAELVRQVLLGGAAEAFGSDIEAMLFAAARRDHVETLIRPALSAGHIVLCDRFLDSTRVYQGQSAAMPPKHLQALEVLAIDSLMPDITFLLDLDATEGLARASSRRGENAPADRFEKETLQTHVDRRNAYLALAVAEPDRFVLIPANRPEDVIADEIALVVRTHIAAQILRQDAENA
jgi:dTMP kinase